MHFIENPGLLKNIKNSSKICYKGLLGRRSKLLVGSLSQIKQSTRPATQAIDTCHISDHGTKKKKKLTKTLLTIYGVKIIYFSFWARSNSPTTNLRLMRGNLFLDFTTFVGKLKCRILLIC